MRAAMLVAAALALAAGEGPVRYDPAKKFPSSPGLHDLTTTFSVDGRTFTTVVGLSLPAAYFKATRDKPMPLVLTLHNTGAKGNTNNQGILWSEGLAAMVAPWAPKHDHISRAPAPKPDPKRIPPFVLLAPQCPADMEWDRPPMLTALGALIDDLAGRLNIDRERVLLTGYSHGGSQTWNVARAMPGRFSAVVPISGRAPADPVGTARALKHLPVLIGVAEKDHGWALEGAKAMHDALKSAGCAKLMQITIPGGDHWSYPAIYCDPAMWEALLALKRPGAAK